MTDKGDVGDKWNVGDIEDITFIQRKGRRRVLQRRFKLLALRFSEMIFRRSSGSSGPGSGGLLRLGQTGSNILVSSRSEHRSGPGLDLVWTWSESELQV